MSTAAARVVRVLELLVQAGRPLSVTELGARLGTGKSSVSRLLRDLARHGLLEREEARGRFRLGLRLAQFARAALEGTALREVGAPHLRALCDAVNESVHLAIFRGGQVIYIDKLEASTFVRTSTEIGDTAPPHCTASGKAILAWLPEPDVRRWLRGRKLAGHTPRTLTAPDPFLRHLGAVRARGYAVDDEEYHPGVRCAAAPIRNHAGEVVASVGISGLAIRLKGAHWQEAVRGVRRTAAAITAALGGAAPEPPPARRSGGGRRAGRERG
jgi:DNA-binding IclR family transcriptional regulator